MSFTLHVLVGLVAGLGLWMAASVTEWPLLSGLAAGALVYYIVVMSGTSAAFTAANVMGWLAGACVLGKNRGRGPGTGDQA